MSDDGGDAACWLERVCDACGGLVEADRPHTCRAAVGRRDDAAPADDQDATER